MFQVNPQLDIPIYQQLVDQIRAQIKKGDLPAGRQLPTVQEVSQSLTIAKGTIKRAYDELERQGLIEKVQGRGTFVRGQLSPAASRKDLAMEAIDRMLDKLEAMGFSPMETGIFLDLKLRQRAEQGAKVKIALVECNTENLGQMSQQLRALGQVELYTYLLDTLRQYPYNLAEDLDLVVTTDTHAGDLEQLLSGRRVIRVALRLSPQCLLELLHLPKGSRVGILSQSPRFGRLLHSTCRTYAEEVRLSDPTIFSPRPDLGQYLQDQDAVLVPTQYAKFCSAAEADALRRFPGPVIECGYEMDEGSFLYLREKTKRLLAAKAI